MKIAFLFTYSFWWLLLLFLLLAVSIFWFYFYSYKGSLSKSRRRILSIMRLIGLAILVLLLGKPVLKTWKMHLQKPQIIVAIDNSQSIVGTKDSTWIRQNLLDEVQSAFNELIPSYDLKWIQFGEKVDSLKGDFNDQETNYSELFKYLDNKYYKQNIGALIIASDGINTRGESPMYASQKANYLIHTIALGDTTPQQDIGIQQIDFNKTVYKGTTFPVFVNVDAFDMEAQKAQLVLYKGKKLLQKQTIEIDSKYFFKKFFFRIPADTTGLQAYRVKVETDAIQDNQSNNHKEFVVEVSDQTKDILLLFHGYHPDIAVFNRVVDENPVYKLTMLDAAKKIDSIEKYELAILYQLPSSEISLQNIFPKLVQNNTPLLYVLGEKSFIEAYNNLNTNYQIEQQKSIFTDVTADKNDGFSLFTTSFSDEILQSFPPLHIPFGTYPELAANQSLLFQRVGAIQTKRPLWCFSSSESQKTGYIFGEGIWRWSIQEYKQLKNHSITSELISKTIQYLSVSKKKQWIDLELPVMHSQNIPMAIKAKVYNASEELITSPELKFELIDSKNNRFPYVFQPSVESYSLNLGMLEEGAYHYKVSTIIGDSVYSKNGRFFVSRSNVELNNLKANYQQLSNLAQEHGGNRYTMNQLDELIYSLNKNMEIKPVYVETKDYKDLLDNKFLFVILTIVLFTEWFLRKFWGSY